MKVGVLGLQGAVREHGEVLSALGVDPVWVRTPDALGGLEALVLPGGESTTMSFLLDSSGLFEGIAELIAEGIPVLGTCAGLILLASEVLDGRPDQHGFAALDVSVRRNGYGRQVASFEAELAVEGIDGGAYPGVFIRAPRIIRVGEDVTVLATFEGDPVAVRSGSVWATCFHPELSGDLRLHQHFVREVRA